MRLTYVAQHAVHQLEERQDKIEESWLAPWFIRPKTLDIKDDNAEAKKERSVVRPEAILERQKRTKSQRNATTG